jgi:hypothetical protein
MLRHGRSPHRVMNGFSHAILTVASGFPCRVIATPSSF